MAASGSDDFDDDFDDEDDDEVDGGERAVGDAPQLTMQVREPAVVDHIGDAMGALGGSVESVALILVKIAYDDTAAVVPTEAARALVAEAIGGSIRYEDSVARVGENSFVVVALLRPGSPAPTVIEKRLLRAARRATGWTSDSPSFLTDHLIVVPETVENPEDVLLTLLRS